MCDRLLLFLLLATAIPRPALAQIGYQWTLEELNAKSDVVVIAQFRATEDTGRRTTNPDLEPSMPEIEMSSSFDVLAVLKGQSGATTRRMSLRHYRVDGEAMRRKLGPTGAVVNAGSRLAFGAVGATYVLFLKRGTDGQFEPLSGRVFPDDSVYRITTLGGANPRQ